MDKTKNNNQANDTFAANHALYFSDKQLTWQPDNTEAKKLVSDEARLSIEQAEALLFTKKFAYKNFDNTLTLVINEPIDTSREIKEVVFYTVQREELPYKLQIVSFSGERKEGVDALYNLELKIKIVDGKVDLKQVWFIGLLG